MGGAALFAVSQHVCKIQGEINMHQETSEIIQPYSFSNWTNLEIQWDNGTTKQYSVGELSQWRINNRQENLTLRIESASPLPLQVYDENGKITDFYGTWQFYYTSAAYVDWVGIHLPGPFFRVGNTNAIPINVTISIIGYAETNDCS